MKIAVPDSDSEMAEQFHEASAPASIVLAGKSRAPPVLTYDNSKPSNYPAFRTFLEAQWVLTGNNYVSQAEFILHCYGHLVDGASSQVHNYVKTMLKKPEEANVEKFLEHLDTLFVDPAAAARALHQVSTLRVNLSASPQAHVSMVTQLLNDAGSSAWADNVKKRQLTATLPKKVRDALASHPDVGTYEEYTTVVMVVWQKLCEDFPTAFVAPPPAPVHTHRHSQPAPDAMDWTPTPVAAASHSAPNKPRAKWVPPAVLESRKQNRLCFRCGASGHVIRTCPYLPPTPPTGQRPTRVNNSNVVVKPLLETDENNGPSPGSEHQEN
ncbi:Retrotransposable element Tf2 155 kDa protein type 1 [Ceratocystis lukuohia]